MITDTEGIVLRQTKTVNGRRMILLFSKKFGKISVGSNLTEGGKNKSALAARPFTLGRYELFKSRDNYSLNNAQVLKSFYTIGENLEKYAAASYVLELTEKVLTEELAQPGVYKLLEEFLQVISKREKKQETLVMAYLVKLLDAMGTMPELDRCVCCGEPAPQKYFSINEGGMVCEKCASRIKTEDKQALIYDVNFGIVDILRYFQKTSFTVFEKLALEEVTYNKLHMVLKQYMEYHLDIGQLKSESFFNI